jgi:anionic cell wall polymer biosynthesis LytR-Cps2A-Psr (LCP) family protein
MIIVGSAMLVISGGSLMLLYGLSARYKQPGRPRQHPRGVQAPTDDDHGMNFLVLGSDSRADQSHESLDETGNRSDTIMIVHVNKAKTGAFIVSIPRDSYVDIVPVRVSGTAARTRSTQPSRSAEPTRPPRPSST